MSTSTASQGLFQRLAETGREPLTFTLDGQVLAALHGDTVMTALLTHGFTLRHSEFSRQARSGFCLMGACQDCWVSSESGQRYQACATLVEPGMRLLTEPGSAT